MKTLLGVVLFAELFLFAAPVPAQSVADLARRERERRKETAGKVYTNSDLPSVAAPAPAPATPAGEAKAGEAKPAEVPAGQPAVRPTGRTDNKGRDEKYWRSAFQAARDALKSAQDDVRIGELKVNDLNKQLMTQTSLYNREYRLAGDIEAAKTALDESRLGVERARQKIADLEEELRRSNGLPGWAS